MLIVLRELGDADVGNARARMECLPKDTNNISDRQLNTLHWINDKRNLQIQQRFDKNVVTMVTTLHTPEDTTRRIWKKPGSAQPNNNHMELVWGTEYEKKYQYPES